MPYQDVDLGRYLTANADDPQASRVFDILSGQQWQQQEQQQAPARPEPQVGLPNAGTFTGSDGREVAVPGYGFNVSAAPPVREVNPPPPPAPAPMPYEGPGVKRTRAAMQQERAAERAAEIAHADDYWTKFGAGAGQQAGKDASPAPVPASPSPRPEPATPAAAPQPMVMVDGRMQPAGPQSGITDGYFRTPGGDVVPLPDGLTVDAGGRIRPQRPGAPAPPGFKQEADGSLSPQAMHAITGHRFDYTAGRWVKR